jgi:heme/copper-type cytochrome/quinol oxidase subunit 2
MVKELPRAERAARGNWILIASILFVVVIGIPIVAVAVVIVAFAIRRKKP